MKTCLFTLLAVVFFAAPAFANDFCDGVNPLHHPQCQTERAPLVCGYERVKPEGSIATTSDYVCRRGGIVVFVRKGSDNNYNIGDAKKRDY